MPQVCHVVPKLAEVTTHPDATLADLREWVQSVHGLTVSHTALWKMLTKRDLRLKKVAQGRRTGSRGRRPGARSGVGSSRNATPSGWFS